MRNHPGDHLARAEIKPKLNGEKHHGKEDADKGDEKARTVVQQVAYREFNNHRYKQRPRLRGRRATREGEGIGGVIVAMLCPTSNFGQSFNKKLWQEPVKVEEEAPIATS